MFSLSFQAQCCWCSHNTLHHCWLLADIDTSRFAGLGSDGASVMTGKKYGVSALFIWQASGYNRISCWFSCTMSSLAGLKVHSHLAYIVHFAILHLPLNVFKIGLVNRIEPSRPSCSSMSYSELFVRTRLEASDQTKHKTTQSAGCQLSPILFLKSLHLKLFNKKLVYCLWMHAY